MASKQNDIDRMTAPGLYRVERGLYLQVRSPTSRSWIFRYRFRGVDRSLGLGSAADVTLAHARNLRDDQATVIRSGIDPVAERANSAVRAAAEERSRLTFRQRAEEYLTAHEAFWSNAKHREQWRGTLKNYVYPAIGHLPAAAITVADIVELLRPLWVAKNETARRVRGRIEAILDYCADPDDVAYRNPAAKTTYLMKALPKVKRVVENHPALPYSDLPAFFADLAGCSGMAARALAFVILTASRTTEVLGARWDEINMSQRLWLVPAPRMKMRRDHAVPLSVAALAVLAQVRDQRCGAFVFPSLPHDRPLSNMALLTVLKRMARPDITTHGFRSTFRDWAGDCSPFDRETIEFSLAHTLNDKTESAYRRSTGLAKRRDLMQAWGEFCMGQTGDVIAFGSRERKGG
jgi:integrase